MPEETDKERHKADEEKGFFDKLFSDEDEDKKDFDPWAGIARRQVEAVRIGVGFTDPDLSEVTEGLSEGDMIVVLGAAHLHHESRVKLPGDPKPAQRSDGGSDTGAAAE